MLRNSEWQARGSIWDAGNRTLVNHVQSNLPAHSSISLASDYFILFLLPFMFVCFLAISLVSPGSAFGNYYWCSVASRTLSVEGQPGCPCVRQASNLLCHCFVLNKKLYNKVLSPLFLCIVLFQILLNNCFSCNFFVQVFKKELLN